MLSYSVDRVFPFVASLVPGLHRADDMRAIGWIAGDGLMQAGVVYENINRWNAWAHIAAVDGAKVPPSFLFAGFAYPFESCGVRRLSGYVAESNAACRRLVVALGFHEEARLASAADDGSDVILYVMWRGDCRYVQVPPKRV